MQYQHAETHFACDFVIGSYTGVITKTADEENMELCLQMLGYAYTQEDFLYFN